MSSTVSGPRFCGQRVRGARAGTRAWNESQGALTTSMGLMRIYDTSHRDDLGSERRAEALDRVRGDAGPHVGHLKGWGCKDGWYAAAWRATGQSDATDVSRRSPGTAAASHQLCRVLAAQL